VSNGSVNPPYAINKTMYFVKPWTTAGLIPAGVNNSQIQITHIFPNPSTDIVKLKFSTTSENSKLFLVHSKGYIVCDYDVFHLSEFTFNASFLSPGIYWFFLVSDGYYSKSRPFVKSSWKQKNELFWFQRIPIN
jgi:hypothetical protein